MPMTQSMWSTRATSSSSVITNLAISSSHAHAHITSPSSGRVPEDGRFYLVNLYIQFTWLICIYNSWIDQIPCLLQRLGQVFELQVAALHLVPNVQDSHACVVDKLITCPSSSLLAVEVNALLEARSQSAAYSLSVVVVAVFSHVVIFFQTYPAVLVFADQVRVALLRPPS